MRRVLLALSLLVVFRCAAPAPEPAAAPPPPPIVAAPEPVEEPVIGTVRVTASALNVRKEASTEAEAIAQAKKGQVLSVLAEDESWVRVKLANGDKGFVAARFVTHDVATKKKKSAPKKTGCPADSDFAFVETPTLAFSETPKPGMVVVEASVNTKGAVTATKVVSNSTGDETMAFLAQREIRSATFAPPIRNCVPRAFIFTYRRTF